MCVQFLGQKIPWSRKWQTTPMVLPGKSRGQSTLGGPQTTGSQRDRKELDTTKQLSTHQHTKRQEFQFHTVYSSTYSNLLSL